MLNISNKNRLAELLEDKSKPISLIDSDILKHALFIYKKTRLNFSSFHNIKVLGNSNKQDKSK